MESILRLFTFVGPRHRREAGRFAKFVVVGSIGFIVDTTVLNLIVIGLDLSDSHQRTIAKAISFSAALCSNFIWHRVWTYRDSRSKPIALQLVQFGVVSLVGLGLNLLIFSKVGNWAVPYFQATHEPVVGLALGTNVAQVCAVGFAMLWNFIINRLWTYGDVS
jgi:putative flippase GtrA